MPWFPGVVYPPVVHPTKCCVKHNCINNVVPHIHPSHTTTVNHINYQHKHFFPHTQSAVNEVTNQHFICPGPMGPVAGPAPGIVPGPGFGPAPGAGPGPGPSPFPYFGR